MLSSTPDALWKSQALAVLQPAAVECRGLRRRVGRRWVLNGVDLVIPVGARVVVSGTPDEAPSLLLKVFAGLARVTSGTIRVAGLSMDMADRPGWARRVGYVGSEPGVPAWMTPTEALELAARLAGLDGPERARRVEESLAEYGLVPSRDKSVKRAGRKVHERTALAAALIADPEVLLLDEPLSSHGAEDRFGWLRIRGARRTVLMASPDPLRESGLVDRVVVLREGRVAMNARVGLAPGARAVQHEPA